MIKKKAILELLQELRSMGKDRRTIETELNYSPNYIDQVLSKGGNERFFIALQRYHEMLIDARGHRYDRESQQDPGAAGTFAMGAGGTFPGGGMGVAEPAAEYGGDFWKQIPEYRHCDYATQTRGTAMQPLIRH